MNGVDARSALGDDVLEGRVYLQHFIHAQHVQKDSTLEHNRNLVLVGESENSADRMPALGIGLNAHDDIGQRSVGAIGKGVLIVDLIDGVGGDKARTNDILQRGDDLI